MSYHIIIVYYRILILIHLIGKLAGHIVRALRDSAAGQH